MTYGEFRRLCLIVRIFFHYNLDELIPLEFVSRVLRLYRRCLFWIPNEYLNQPQGVRLRLALEQLGPIWIKFGQMLSTRHDLLPIHISEELTLLQDSVTPFDGLKAQHLIESALNAPIHTQFNNFNITPLASASIAQVHTATLKNNGCEVIIKIIRPEILSLIQSDLKLIYRLALWIPHFIPSFRSLHLIEVVHNYEKTLLNELNLLREADNAMRMRRNFYHSQILYVPKIYRELCTKNILVMERIYGIPISNIVMLIQYGVNLNLLAERGVHIFFTQVFRDSFFHADMHPGNIFVNYMHPDNPQYIGIDYGIVGTLQKEDKRYLAENFLAFLNRDYRKVATLHIDSGWVPPGTDIEDFEFAIRSICEPIFKKPLIEISFAHLLISLFNITRSFHMEIQPQLVLLQKTLLYVEGLGRQLDPNLDLWKTAKPFLEDWIQNQIGIPAILQTLKNKIPIWASKLPELPDLFYEHLKQNKNIQNRIDRLASNLYYEQNKQKKSYCWFSLSPILLLSNIMLLILSSEWTTLSIGLIISGWITWLIGWWIRIRPPRVPNKPDS
ncbi:Probable protein kinase UbiB [Candidatus Erwinia haradaeae]|uniref:Probable protein kinase UbiB n=1 Tax=Candidatus Erwinia haradaeae TaxID=1922217 RepID=A0A451D0H5_9GAMM|nr:ubiquinone biosynthesis regulatory protein kinase UbiB [Candidatus Erwinia haradaeae]VFP78936.1 Probable protein kinase UbiB [Candidatus Erwinia haradaeae]